MPEIVLNRHYKCLLEDSPWYGVEVVPMYRQYGQHYECFSTKVLSDKEAAGWRHDGCVILAESEMEEICPESAT